jgi:N12 class adenine-specific DNA methylase
MSAEKADIFFRRTVGLFKRIEKCESVQEALIISISEKGVVDPVRIASLLGKTKDAAMSELEELGAVFVDPQTGMYESSDAYLSGNIRDKLAAARLAGDKFQNNVKALEAILPSDIPPQDINARIGSTWIPAAIYTQFINQLLGLENNEVSFNEHAGAWNVKPDYRASYVVDSTQTYGTSKVNAVTLFEQALNQVVPKVYKESPSDPQKRVVDQNETIAAREKQAEIKEKFVEWLWSDDARASMLVKQYNKLFNSVVPRRYDGKHLVLPGFSRTYQLRKHQVDAIWRIVASGLNTLLAHAVGAGKTLEMICAGMELRRIGKASKPMFVVPNHMLEQFAAEFLRAYPGANILMASKDDLQGDKRRMLISRIATGDWDGVLITHSSFERIKLSDGVLKSYIEDQIAEIESAIMSEQNDRGNKIVKELEKAKKIWKVKLAKLSAKEKKDDVLCFEDLGIDWLFVDEAHYFKNLFRHTKMTNVAGLPNSNSERAFDMFVKTRQIMQKHDGKAGVVFATGTPVANSMAEMWVMQKFLQPKTLEALQIASFDTWAGNFGESVTALELAPDGSGYRMQTRFARFVNLPELMTVFSEIADIKTAEMLNLPVPKSVKETISIKASQELKCYVETLVDRAERVRSGQVRPSEDNMLSVTNDGRKAALDMRLVSPVSLEEGKSSFCAQKVYSVWQETSKVKGTQLVFCDLSTPKEDGTFNVYQDLRQKLVEMGIPGAEIAFIHSYDSDAAKAELFKSVRDGVIRVLIGSTNKMGVGTNVQTRLAALHHLDAPWRPADIEQREGRIIRQGNLNEEVRIYRYVTEGSFDAYLWQTLETKARFIAQVMMGDSGMRCVEDVELAALSYAEVKALASGNPLVLEKAGVDTEVAKLAILKSKWDSQQWSNKAELARMPMMIEGVSTRVEKIKMDCAHVAKLKGLSDHLEVEVDGVKSWKLDQAAEIITKKMLQIGARQEKEVGLIGGFSIEVAYDGPDRGWSATLVGAADYEIGSVRGGMNLLNKCQRELEDLGRHLDAAKTRLENLIRRQSDLEKSVNQPFDKLDRLQELRKRQEQIDLELGLMQGDGSAVDESDESDLVAAQD